MNNTSTINKSLLKDLQELVTENIITPDTAQKIENFYKNKKDAPSEKFNIVLGILGALLVGFGIVLLVAHNWDEMPVFLQTIFAFLPLATGQCLCLYTLLRKKGNIAWREASSVILFFAVASCIALISQVYHISDTLSGFILTWLLLTAPLVYIMKSSLISLLVIAVATWYAVLVGYQAVFSTSVTHIPYFYLFFLVFLLPHYYQHFKTNRSGNFFHLHNWFLVISAITALGTFVEKAMIFFNGYSLDTVLYLVSVIYWEGLFISKKTGCSPIHF